MTAQQAQDKPMLAPLEVLRLYPAHDGTFRGALTSRAQVAAQRNALVFQGRHWTFDELCREVERAGAVLRAQGVRAGDKVGVMSANHPSTMFTLFALADLGAVMVPVNPDYGVQEAHYVFDHAQVCGILCSPEALPTVRAACERIAPAPWLMLNQRATDGSAPDLPGFADAPLARTEAANPATSPSGDADAVCLFIYTSGTTGFPKGVMHSQRNVLTAGEGFVERMFLQPDERLLCILPMFHINAICYSMAGALAAGATLILEPRFSASTFWKTVKETGATEANTIAAASSILMLRPRSEFVGGHKLRKIYGAPFDARTIRVFDQEFEVPHLIEGYGMSEIPGALNNPFAGPRKVGSMGKPSRHPDPSTRLAELRIVDDEGRDLPDGQTGELVVQTPIVMKGYFRDPVQTRAAFRDGWFLTGDLAWRDQDGYYWFVARKKDIIRKRGENISGAELDRVVGNHPAVLEAAAIAVPSELGEDEILMVVALREGATMRAQEVADWCRQHLAPIKTPRYVAFTKALPHTPTHRVAKYLIKQDQALLASKIDLLA
jgi:crotonobetaine/carnitine-CoA ligase